MIIALAIAMSSCGAEAQKTKDSDVPVEVKTAFEKLYPNVKDVDWVKEDANYEAGFEDNKIETSVVLDATGKVLETEVEIKSSEFPQGVTDYLTTNHPNVKIKESAKITDADGKVTYEAEINNTDLIFDSDGNFLKEIKKSKEEEED